MAKLSIDRELTKILTRWKALEKRGWRQVDVVKRTKLSSGGVSLILRGQQKFLWPKTKRLLEKCIEWMENHDSPKEKAAAKKSKQKSPRSKK